MPGYYLCSQRTVEGIEAERLRLIQEHEAQRRKYFYFHTKIWGSIHKVSSKVFPEPVAIRAYMKANRSEHHGGNSPDWDEWLEGADSEVMTYGQEGLNRFFYIPVEEFNALSEGHVIYTDQQWEVEE